ncbi:uncharacterized protein [Miscanthus floridulus]|uniref:uncharacterized protein n=1 Tax=Miscanthus floridulus TaxID=154761 RepID=UPI00345A6CAE
MTLLNKMGKIKFITADILAMVEETTLDPDVFQMLESVWVRAVGIQDNARSEFAIMELARLVGDPEEVHLPSLQWRSVWIRISCKNPNKIGGTYEVFINKKGRKISWYYSDKLSKFPPSKPDDDLDDNDDEITDEEDPESQESHGWLESGKPPPKSPTNNTGAGTSDYKGKKCGLLVLSEADGSSASTDVLKEIQNLASMLNPHNMAQQ